MRSAVGGVLMVSGEGARSWSCLREAGAIQMTKAAQPSCHVGPAKSGCASDSSQAWAKLAGVWSPGGQWLDKSVPALAPRGIPADSYDRDSVDDSRSGGHSSVELGCVHHK